TGDTNDITSVTISSGNSSASFKYKDDTPGNPTITASNASPGYTSGTQLEAIADKLAFTTTAHNLKTNTISGTMTVQLQASDTTPVNAVGDGVQVDLASDTAGTGTFRNAGNTADISNVTISSGNSSASFKYRAAT